MTGAKDSFFGRRHHRFVGIAISLATIAVVLAGVELAGYLWERRTAQGRYGWTLVASRRMPLVRRGSREDPYYLLTPGEHYEWEGIPVVINDQGFRDEAFSKEKAIGTFRTLNLGDSVVFGWEVPQEATYGKRLEQMLNALDDKQIHEVINAGIPGWNPAMERAYLLQDGLSYAPDVVILSITLVNDILGQAPEESRNPKLFDWLRDNTHAWPFITAQARFLLAKRIGPEAIPVLNPPRAEEYYYPLQADDVAWKLVWASIMDMQRMTRETGARFILLVFPTAFQLNSVGHSDFPQRLISQLAADSDTEVVDMLPIYQRTCKENGPDACEGYENLLFADVWMHPTSLGHRLAAEALLDLYTGS